MRPEREALIGQFLIDAGWAGQVMRPLAGDASPRRYYRLGSATDPSASRAVLMDDEDGGAQAVGRFAALANHLQELGIRAPAVLACDLERGILLLEDLGDDLVATVLQNAPELETTCYRAAVDLLAELGRHPPPSSVAFEGTGHQIDPYDMDPLMAEAMLLIQWWLPGAGAPATADASEEFRHLVSEAVAGVAPCTDVLVLRDYHAENLLWLDAGGAVEWRGIGVLDFQDALAGHPAYDLVSLLEDARRDTSPALREEMYDRFTKQAGMSRNERSDFRAACAALGAQRNLKILGIFARLCIRDDKPGYLDLTPRVWNHLLRDLAHPTLAALDHWVRKHAPEPTSEALARARSRRGAE